MPFCSKLIIKLINHYKFKISVMRILRRSSDAGGKGRGLSRFTMQITYLDDLLSDF
jgi:hypothetical protein